MAASGDQILSSQGRSYSPKDNARNRRKNIQHFIREHSYRKIKQEIKQRLEIEEKEYLQERIQSDLNWLKRRSNRYKTRAK